MSSPMLIQGQLHERDTKDDALETVIAAGSGQLNLADLYGVGNNKGNGGSSKPPSSTSDKPTTANTSSAQAASTTTTATTTTTTTSTAPPPPPHPPSNTNNANNSTDIQDPSGGTFTCKSAYIDFSDPSALSKFSFDWCPQNSYQTSNSVVWRLTQECGTTMIYPWDFHYGKIEGRIRISGGSGVVTTMLLLGPAPSDEIDFEWVGKDVTHVQTMYYVQSKRVDPIPLAYGVKPNPDMSTSFHNYAIELNKDSVKWYIDGYNARTLPKDDREFPKYATRARMGIWDGTQTSGWAGTVDWSKGPFTAEMQWFKFTPYC
ncbi:putative glycosidase CRH2 [Dipsacomyces acuminosporus]|nr:putative glycosidase CRH2 [Dipsacomyces acuminosporus]